MHIFNATVALPFTQKPQVEHNQLLWEVVWVIIIQSHWQRETRSLFHWAPWAFQLAACCLRSRRSSSCHFGTKRRSLTYSDKHTSLFLTDFSALWYKQERFQRHVISGNEMDHV